MLAGKLAFITGAGSGIGRECCRVFAREGAKIVASDKNINAAEETLGLLPGGGDNLSLKIDVVNQDSVRSALKAIINKYASPPTVVVNSAGVTNDQFLLKMSPDCFQENITVNLIGTFNVVQAACGYLVESKQPGSIVTLGSLVGQIGNIGQTNYAASKAGVEAFSKSVAKEMGQFGIRCNTVLPGFILTPMTETIPDKVKEMFRLQIPLARFGEPAEVAEVIAFLGSDRSSYINGESLKVTGGI